MLVIIPCPRPCFVIVEYKRTSKFHLLFDIDLRKQKLSIRFAFTPKASFQDAASK